MDHGDDDGDGVGAVGVDGDVGDVDDNDIIHNHQMSYLQSQSLDVPLQLFVFSSCC